MNDKVKPAGLEALARRARRALPGTAAERLVELAKRRGKEDGTMQGMGPRTLAVIPERIAAKGLMLLFLFGTCGLGVSGQPAVKRVAVAADPEPRVRPLESIVLWAKAYGEVPDGEKTREVRLRMTGYAGRVTGEGAGWVSKGFKYQGKDEEAFYQENSGSSMWAVIGSLKEQFLVQDAILYTAPEKPGKYTVEVRLQTVSGWIEIEVTPEAPARKKEETVSFPEEPRSADPYRKLAEHWAPFIAQETWWQPKSDYIARWDFDGDWHGDNNWDNQETGSSQAYVYYAAMETTTHWFLVYTVMHPRDYSDKCMAGSCHENDNEGIVMTVRKDGSEFGRLQAMETLAHNMVYSATADRRITRGAHGIEGAIEFWNTHHPVVFIESGGHGIYIPAAKTSRFRLSSNAFQTTGVTYVYKGVAERPRHPDDREVGYDLLPIYDHFWVKADKARQGADRLFAEYRPYRPMAGRPGIPFAEVATCFLGVKEGANKAKPFWGWHDVTTRRRKILADGQWALDPAYSVSRNLTFPRGEPFSLDYVFNPYLGIGEQ